MDYSYGKFDNGSYIIIKGGNVIPPEQVIKILNGGKEVIRWEYKVLSVEEKLSELGNVGWELINVNDGTAYFKRLRIRKMENDV